MAEFTASNAAQLASALAAANASTDPVNTVTLTASIVLTADLPILHPDAGSTIVIDGAGFTIDGDHAHRIFFADSGNLVIKDVTLSNGYAKGGDGGDGSSGAGGAAFGDQDGGNGADGLALGQDAAGNGATANGTGGTGGLDGGGGGGGGGGAILEEGGGGGGGGIGGSGSSDRSGSNGG